MQQRVVITGIGAITPLGHTLADSWAAMRDGRPGIAEIQSFDPDPLFVKIAAEVKGFDPKLHFERAASMMMDRVAQLGVVAAREAASQCGIDFREDIGLETSAILGTAVGGAITQEQGYRRLFEQGGDTVHPYTVPKLMVNAPASHVSMELGIRGPVYAVASACSSSNHAMSASFDLVRSGNVKVAVTGGAEACIGYGPMRAWEALRVLADDTCRPFSRDRSGMVMGEGAAIFVFEALEHAEARGAEILAEVLGFGISSDAASLVQPSVEGAARAVRAALANASLAPESIDYVNAHGTGTVLNDQTESEVMQQVFGLRTKELPVSSTKSMHGHALGAAGALEMAATVMALRDGVVPPTINFSEPDPSCELFCVPNQPIERELDVALSNSFAFGGLNAAAIVKRWR